MFLKNVFSKICGPYKFIFTFTNIYILKRMPLFILAVLPGNWIVHCTFLSSLVYIRLIFVQFSLFLYSSVCKSVWKSHPYENSLIPTLVWILYVQDEKREDRGEEGEIHKNIGRKRIKQWKDMFGSGGIRTHASEETGALNQRLRPLGHATLVEIENIQFNFKLCLAFGLFWEP